RRGEFACHTALRAPPSSATGSPGEEKRCSGRGGGEFAGRLSGSISESPCGYREAVQAMPSSTLEEVPGPIVLFGSGEAAPSARRAHAVALESIRAPVRASVLETPAGFEPNSAGVANRLAEYLRHRFQLETCVVPARKRGTPESPDE